MSFIYSPIISRAPGLIADAAGVMGRRYQLPRLMGRRLVVGFQVELPGSKGKQSAGKCVERYD